MDNTMPPVINTVENKSWFHRMVRIDLPCVVSLRYTQRAVLHCFGIRFVGYSLEELCSGRVL